MFCDSEDLNIIFLLASVKQAWTARHFRSGPKVNPKTSVRNFNPQGLSSPVIELLYLYVYMFQTNNFSFTNKIQQDATAYQFFLFHIYMKLNIFRATHRPSSGA